MAITYLNQYSLQGGTTTLTMVPPASSAAGDLDIIFVANKNSSVTPSDPAGWILLNTFVVGTGADGAGTGQIRLTAWYRILSGASTSTGVTITGANRSLGGGMIYQKGASETWAVPTITSGSDTDGSTTTFAALMAANLGVLVGEFLLSFGAFTSNTTIPGRNIAVPGMTQTSVGINSFGNTTGNHLFVFTDHTQPSAGTQSGASTTQATSGAGTTGGAINLRIGLAAGDATAAPAVVSGVVAVPQATPSAGATQGPAVVAAVAGLPQATPAVSDSAAPSAVSSVVSVPQATVTGDAVASPAAIAITVGLPASNRNISVVPAAVAAVAGLPAAAAVTGVAATATPSVVSAIVGVPAAVPSAGVVMKPAAVAAIVALPGASPSIGVTAAPATIPTSMALPSASPHGGAVARPGVVTILVTIPAAGVPSIVVGMPGRISDGDRSLAGSTTRYTYELGGRIT